MHWTPLDSILLYSVLDVRSSWLQPFYFIFSPSTTFAAALIWLHPTKKKSIALSGNWRWEKIIKASREKRCERRIRLNFLAARFFIPSVVHLSIKLAWTWEGEEKCSWLFLSLFRFSYSPSLFSHCSFYTPCPFFPLILSVFPCSQPVCVWWDIDTLCTEKSPLSFFSLLILCRRRRSFLPRLKYFSLQLAFQHTHKA